MALKLYFHPLSSYCHKVLIALYENGTAFEPQTVNLMDEKENADFRKLWPIGKFPVLRDETANRIIPESSIIIEYLDQHFPGKVRFIPADPDKARQVRLSDRFCDLYLHSPMQKMTIDKMRPEGSRDAYGVDEAKKMIRTALDKLSGDIGDKAWITGDQFTMADCAAAPPLFYIDMMESFEHSHPRVWSYLERLKQRPSYARVLEEAKPFLHMVPR